MRIFFLQNNYGNKVKTSITSWDNNDIAQYVKDSANIMPRTNRRRNNLTRLAQFGIFFKQATILYSHKRASRVICTLYDRGIARIRMVHFY